MPGRETHQGYILIFRCINCGKYQAFALYPTEGIEPYERIRARVYQVRCRSCGWRGEACGVSATNILHSMEIEAWGAR